MLKSALSSQLSPDIDATTVTVEHTDETLQVLPLKDITTAPSTDKDETVTLSMTVNSFDAKIKPEMINNKGVMAEQSLINRSDNPANQPQKELAQDETEGKSRSSQGKEGRAINYPLDVSINSQMSSTMPSPANFVTSSTEKTRVMSFFDLSDVSMDRDEHENRETKLMMKTSTETPSTTIATNCFNNGTNYKVSVKLT